MRHLWIVLCISCSDNAKISKKMDIGPAGGEVSAGGATVAIPAGALSVNTTITVTSTEAPPPTDTVAVGTAFVFGPEGTQFAQPVTITLAFSSSLIPSESTSSEVAVYTAPADSTDYQALTTALADASHVQAQTTHFSVFLPAVAHGNKHDMAVITSNDDLSVVVTPDAGSNADLTPMADFGCTPTLSGGSTSGPCTVTETCGSHTYSVNCQVNVCGCLIDGVQTRAINAINACTQTAQQLFTSCFPTA